jgi:hypothetical protein
MNVQPQLLEHLVGHAKALASVLAALGQDTEQVTHDIVEAQLLLAQEEIFD